MNLCKSSANSNDIVSMKVRSKIYSSCVGCCVKKEFEVLVTS
jgi:hypothetical protein